VSAFDTAKQLKKLHPIIEHFPWVNILLLDEVEKAHADVHQQLLSLLDEGRVQLHNGEVVNFENTIVILSSNL
jgi:ATP-dependent Clp protease ATP-binding subunit ClpA